MQAPPPVPVVQLLQKMLHADPLASLQALELPAGPGGSKPGKGFDSQFEVSQVAVAGLAQLVVLPEHGALLSEQTPTEQTSPVAVVATWWPLFRQSSKETHADCAALLASVVGAHTAPTLHAAKVGPKTGSSEQSAL
jgi:hypothetical protein